MKACSDCGRSAEGKNSARGRCTGCYAKWRRNQPGRERLQDQRDVIEAAAAVWKALDRVRARMEQRAGKVAG